MLWALCEIGKSLTKHQVYNKEIWGTATNIDRRVQKMCKLNTLNNKLLIKTNPISKKQAEWAVVLTLMRAVWALLTIIGWNSSSISAYTNTRKHCQTTLFFNMIMLNYYNQIQCYAVIKLLNQKMTLLYHIQQVWQTFHIWKHTHTHKHCLILRFLITKREILLISSFL